MQRFLCAAHHRKKHLSMRPPFTFGSILTISLLACLCHTSCRKTDRATGPDTARAVVLPPSGADVADAENQFTIDLFRAVNLQDTAVKNKMISPLSVYMALAMADNGAGGATRDSINGALRLGNLSLDDLNQTSKALLDQLTLVDPQVTLTAANSMWYNQTQPPLSAYDTTIEGSYLAKVQGLNFADPSSVADINQWVSTQTRQMIPKVITQILPAEKMFLINVLYFKGAWATGFDPALTKNAPFTMAGGVQENVPTMVNTLTGYFPLLQNDSVTLTELRFGAGDFVMDVLEPGPQMDIRRLASSLSSNLLERWYSQMEPVYATLHFPKFSFDYGLDNIAPSLTGMGMGIAFGQSADFSNMYSGQSSLSRVVHKTAIQVDETGTQAAAATAVGVATLDVPAMITLVIDHAFLFVIREKTSGTVLFIGMLNDPLSTGS
jgi:serine protease inhibitor